MRAIGALFILLVLPLTFALREIEDPVQNPLPTITVSFDQEVTLRSYLLTDTEGTVFDINAPTTRDSKVYQFQVSKSLRDGKYIFMVEATSSENLFVSEEIHFTIALPAVPPLNISLANPRVGVSTTSPFDLLITTSRPAYCEYSKFNDPGEDGLYLFRFDEGNQSTATHTVANTSMDASIFLHCEDEKGFHHYKSFYIGFDDTPPILQVRADPLPVIDPSNITTILTLTTDDPSYCIVAGMNSPTYLTDLSQFDQSAYQTSHSLRLSYTPDQLQPGILEEHQIQYVIRCWNRALLAADPQTFTVTIDLDEELGITMLQPGSYTNKQDLDIVIEPSTTAECTLLDFDGEEAPNQFSSSNGRQHTVRVQSLSTGRHNFSVYCSSIIGESTASFTFGVDLTPPSQASIDAKPACDEDHLQASFNASDSGSGVALFNYSITKGTEFLVSGLSTGDTITESIDLVVGEGYTWNVVAVDAAGNEAPKATETVTARNHSSIECDLTEPEVGILFERTEEGGTAQASCEDEGSGCDSTYRYGVSQVQLNCVLDQGGTLGDTISITESSTICVEVKDKNQNTATREESFFIKGAGEADPSHCSNEQVDGDESDIDCGGACTGCSLESSCNTNEDCLSNYCNENVCSIGACADGEKNEDETDVDCGGVECKKCEASMSCIDANDCLSGVCENSICQEATCNDLKKNQEESDVDCGGPCEGCETGLSCNSDDDCAVGYCSFGFCAEQSDADSDGDGMPNHWEQQYTLDPQDPSDAEKDNDDDGLTNLEEYYEGTDPLLADTDGDGHSDGKEVEKGTNPLDRFSYPKSNLLALILIIVGLLCILGGSGYLIYMRVQRGPVQETKEQAVSTQEIPKEERKFVPGVDPLAEAAKRRLEEKVARQHRLKRSIKRKSLMAAFEKEELVEKKKKIDVFHEDPKKAKKSGKDVFKSFEEKS